MNIGGIMVPSYTQPDVSFTQTANPQRIAARWLPPSSVVYAHLFITFMLIIYKDYSNLKNNFLFSLEIILAERCPKQCCKDKISLIFCFVKWWHLFPFPLTRKQCSKTFNPNLTPRFLRTKWKQNPYASSLLCTINSYEQEKEKSWCTTQLQEGGAYKENNSTHLHRLFSKQISNGSALLRTDTTDFSLKSFPVCCWISTSFFHSF